MKKTLLLSLIITLIITINVFISEEQRLKKKKNIYCLVCLSDYTIKPINFLDTCLNPSVNVTDAEFKYLTQCPSDANFCATDISTINNVFILIERRCAGTCTEICFNNGYGTDKKTCQTCCNKTIVPKQFNEKTVFNLTCASDINNFSLQLRLSFQIIGLFLIFDLFAVFI